MNRPRCDHDAPFQQDEDKDDPRRRRQPGTIRAIPNGTKEHKFAKRVTAFIYQYIIFHMDLAIQQFLGSLGMLESLGMLKRV